MIRLSKSSIGNNEKQAVLKVLENEMLGMGQEVNQFENALAEYFKRKVVCVSTGTAALQLAMQALGIGLGDEVLVPSLTYLASFQAISATGAKPVPCEVNDDLLIDLEDASKKINKNTKAIMPVHYSGGVGELNLIYAFAKKYNLRIIEDAAHAFGTLYNGDRIGSFGDVVCFSFDGIKNITSGEGGCVVSSDETLLNTVQDLRLLGVINDTKKRYSGLRSWNFDVTEQGWRYHMSNIMAAIGLEQLKRIDEFAKVRRERAKQYQSLLNLVKEIDLIGRDYDEVVPHIFPVKIKEGISRDEVRIRLEKKGIQTGIHYLPNHTLSYYKLSSNFILPKTEKLYNKLITLPLHVDLSEMDVEYICKELIAILNELV